MNEHSNEDYNDNDYDFGNIGDSGNVNKNYVMRWNEMKAIYECGRMWKRITFVITTQLNKMELWLKIRWNWGSRRR